MSPNRAQRWVVDALEENSASIEVEGGAMIHIPQALLPSGAREGDVLRVTIEVDAAATKQALDASAAQVKKARDASAKRDPGGDITL
jgi:hypothetical protein